MSSDSLGYLSSKPREIFTVTKILVLFSLSFLMILPAVNPAISTTSSLSQASPHTASATSPNITPDFSISANTTSITTTAGSTKHVQITVSSIGGFSGQVPLDAFAFAFPIISADPNPKIVDLSSQPTAISRLTITIPGDEPPGSYSVSLIAAGTCSLFHTLDISLTVTGPDFSIVAEKTRLAIPPSGSDTSNIDLASLNGFASLVSLSPRFSPLTTSLSLPSVALTSGGTGQSILTVTAPPTITAGNYTVTVEGSTNSHILSHTTEILVTITGPSFALTSTKYSLTLVAGGSSNSSTITVTPSGGFTGMVSLGNLPTQPLTISLNPTTVTLPGPNTSTLTVSAPAGAKPDTYYVLVTGSSGAIQGSTFISVRVKGPDFDIFAEPPFLLLDASGPSCSSTISVTSIDSFISNVGLVLTGTKGLTSSLSPNSVTGSGVSTLTVSAPTGTVPGSYRLEVNGTSSSPALTHSAYVEVLVIGPDFIPAANPDSLTILAGSTGASTISFTPVLGFSGTVSLKAKSIDPAITPSLDANSITGSQTAKLTVSVPPTTAPGAFYSIEINATSGNLVNLLDIPLTVIGPGFYFTANPSPITLNEGTSTTSIITIVPTNGFAAPVDLFVIPSSGDLNASIQPATVTSGSYSATLSVNSTIPGHYSVDISGSSAGISGFVSNDTIVDVAVVGPDFSLSTNPTSLTITAGGSKTSTISITPFGGFSSPVDLTASSPTGITTSFNPTTVTSPTPSTLTITVDPSVMPGTYTLDIHGTSGRLDRITQLTINVAGFTLRAYPTSLTIIVGTSQPSAITVVPENGFTGTVQLSASLPTGLTGTPSPNSVTGSGPSTLSIAAAANIAPGTYLVNVTGASGALSQKVTITISVPAPDFDVSATPNTVSCLVGIDCPTTIAIAPTKGFAGTVTFTPNPSQGLSCNPVGSISVPTALTATLSCHASVAGSYTVTVTGASGTISHTTAAITYTIALAPDFTVQAGNVAPSVILAGASGTSAISVSSIGGFSGVVSFQVSASTPSGLTCTTPANINAPGQSNLACNASAAGDYTVTVTGTAMIGGTSVPHTTTNIVFHIVDFSISAGAVTPSPVAAKSTATSTITVANLNGFSGTVSFTVSTSTPSGLACTAPSSVSGITLTSTLSCNASDPGDYTVTVTGTSGTLSHPTGNIVFHVSGFRISATSPAAVTTGQTATSSITITPVNGFTGTVNLSDTSLPSGLTCSPISPASLPLASSAVSASLDCHSSQDGTFTVTVIGTSNSLTSQATSSFTFHTQDITLTSTTPASTTSTQSTTSTITVSPVSGFTGTVTLTVSAPTGLTCALDHTTIQGSGTATLTCSSITANDYTVTITATGGATPHTTTQTFHVSAPTSPAAPAPTILGLTPLLFYGIVGGAILVIVIGGITVVIRRKSP